MRDLKKIVQNMPENLEDFYYERIKFIKEGINHYFPQTINKEFYERITGCPVLFEQDYGVIYDSIFLSTQEYLDRGGKVLRPVLVALCLEAYGYNSFDYQDLLGAIEVMEDSSIILDDYIDNSEMRRDGYCAHVLHGYPLANVSGTTAFGIAHYLFYNNELNLSLSKISLILDALSYEHIHMAFGQLEEFYWTESNINNVTVEQYLQETLARCAFLTFRGPLRYSGLIANAPEKDILILEKIGEYMLIGYHLRGDCLDMSPNSDGWGKIAGEDITTGRRTLLINYVLKSCDPEERKILVEILNSRTKEEGKKRFVYELVMKYKGLEYTQNLAKKYNEITKCEIDKLSISDEYKTLFKIFSDFSSVKRTL